MVFNLWEFSCKIHEENPQETPQRLPKKKIKIELKARFHYEREKDYILFVLLIFSLCLALASILRAERAIKETKNALFHASNGNEP